MSSKTTTWYKNDDARTGKPNAHNPLSGRRVAVWTTSMYDQGVVVKIQNPSPWSPPQPSTSETVMLVRDDAARLAADLLEAADRKELADAVRAAVWAAPKVGDYFLASWGRPVRINQQRFSSGGVEQFHVTDSDGSVRWVKRDSLSDEPVTIVRTEVWTVES